MFKRLAALLLCALSSLSLADDLVYQWSEVLLKSDGEQITGSKEYLLRYSIDDVEQEIITIAGDQTTYTLPNVTPGKYVAQIAASEDGLRGEWSPTVTRYITEKPPAAPERMTFTVTFNCDGCNLEAK